MGQDKAGTQYWDENWAVEPRYRLPIPVFTTIRDTMRLLRANVKPGDRFLEIGCAPGKKLAWVAAKLHAEVFGLDYSSPGIAASRKMFRTLGLSAEFRCEDIFRTSFARESFDVVYSGGVIEHFEDPTEIVRMHVELVKPGGVALITIPNFRGIYGRLLTAGDRAIHNLNIMAPEHLVKLCPPELTESVEAYAYGRAAFANLLSRFVPPAAARFAAIAGELLWVVQPFEIKALCPMLVLKIVRKC